MNNILQRTISGIVYLVLIVGSLYIGKIAFGIVLLCMATLALYEFYKLMDESAGVSSVMLMGLVFGAMMIVLAYLVSAGFLNPKWLSGTLLILLLMFIWALFTNYKKALKTIGIQLLGILYISVPLAVSTYLVFPSSFQHEFTHRIILGLLALIWINDTFAYLVGITMGCHRLYERISPKKSWEGFAGGTVFTIAVAFWMSDIMHCLSKTDWLIMAAIVSIFGVMGDLFESMIKREVNVKDSGNLIPGHGGMLDRIDSMLFVFPTVFIYLIMNNI